MVSGIRVLESTKTVPEVSPKVRAFNLMFFLNTPSHLDGIGAPAQPRRCNVALLHPEPRNPFDE